MMIYRQVSACPGACGSGVCVSNVNGNAMGWKWLDDVRRDRFRCSCGPRGAHLLVGRSWWGRSVPRRGRHVACHRGGWRGRRWGLLKLFRLVTRGRILSQGRRTFAVAGDERTRRLDVPCQTKTPCGQVNHSTACLHTLHRTLHPSNN